MRNIFLLNKLDFKEIQKIIKDEKIQIKKFKKKNSAIKVKIKIM